MKLKPSDIMFNPLEMPGKRKSQLRTVIPQSGGAYGRTYRGRREYLAQQGSSRKIIRF
jgi:hypothetical protein